MTSPWGAGVPTTIEVAGIDLPDRAIAALALLLMQRGQVALSIYVGQTWDRCRPELPLHDRDCIDVLVALQPARPAELQPLYEALLDGVASASSSTLALAIAEANTSA
jgi:hypothetical protein